jgi:glycogen debranching enzyme
MSEPDYPSIEGKQEYSQTPYVTAGDRLYMVGHQDGSFPDLGWHVKGEMGGIWNHPVKLMDGFTEALTFSDTTVCFPPASSFINHPIGNTLKFPAMKDILVERFQFVPDGLEGMAIEYTFINTSEEDQTFTFRFTGMVDLRPVWLGERTGMVDSQDTLWVAQEHRAVMASDTENDWFVMFGAVLPPSDYSQETPCDFERLGMGTSGSLSYDITLIPGQSLSFPVVIAGSHISQEAMVTTFLDIRENVGSMIEAKTNRYGKIKSMTDISIPDSTLEETFEWIKYNTDWLIRDVEGVGRGLSAGIPDYPWWFGADSEYALQGAVMTGRWDLVYETIDLIAGLSEKVNGNGRIIHEVSSNGAVFNPGNINETPQFASLIWKVYNWTGNRDFLVRYYPLVTDGLEWLMKERDADGNGLPDGFGMMEIHGLDSEMIDVAAYTQKAFADAAHMALVLNKTEEAAEEVAWYHEKADDLAQIINTEFWVEDQKSYADFVGTVGQARILIEDAIHRSDSLGKPWAVEELKRTLANLEELPAEEKRAFVVHHNWVVNTPLETGIADPEKAAKALETASRFTNPYGMYVTGIDRDEKAGEETGSFVTNKKIFSYIGAVMTLPTGVQAVSANNYNQPDQALDYLQRMTRSFSFALPGSMYEVSPDYGMIVQAWNIYAFAVPIVEQFFGIRPKASENEIHLSPQMPSEWDQAAISQVRVLDGFLDMTYEASAEGIKLEVNFDGTAELVVSFEGGKYTKWKVDGEVVDPEENKGREVLRLPAGRYLVEVVN